jgi:hypothetical protein
MPSSINTSFVNKSKAFHAAHLLTATQRKEIGIKTIGGNTPISHIAELHDVSRKYVYQQKEIALGGISSAFEESVPEDEKVLFYIPVTKKWVDQFVLSATLTGKASCQGVSDLLRDLCDYDMCRATVHNILYKHMEKIAAVNSQKDLSQVKAGAHDEIYQAGKPILVGCCTRSLYCYLLSMVETCDANSWGVHLLDLKEKQGLDPDFTVIDGGKAARSGQEDAWPDTPAHGDTFHGLHPFFKLICYFGNRLKSKLKYVDELKHKIKHPRGKLKEINNYNGLLEKLEIAEKDSESMQYLINDLEVLFRWLKDDILSLVGPSFEDRKELLDFVIEQLSLREHQCPGRIEPVRTYLENHKENLLMFVPILEKQLLELAQELNVPLADVLEVYKLNGIHLSEQKHWESYNALRSKLGHMFHLIESSVNIILDNTIRASSLVENLNSRTRPYFTLRKEIGNKYLEVLQFFLNHRTFARSECPERIGKSPSELLTGEKHPHWLEMLGYKMFKQVA